jgi:phytoene dehydrogenase-like protein
MTWNPDYGQPEKYMKVKEVSGTYTTQGFAPFTPREVEGWMKISGLLPQNPFARDLLRSIIWTPPHPQDVDLTPENMPYMQVYKKYAPDVWDPKLLDMTLFEMLDQYCDTEPFKTWIGGMCWLSGASPEWEGVAIPCLAAVLLVMYTGDSRPRGGMHNYFHAILRCAVAHGAVIRACCPVEEIIIQGGRAVGVRLKDNAAWGEKTIYAKKAVISGCDIYQTFQKLIGPRHLDVGFMQRIKDISLKGSSLYVTHYLLKNKPRLRAKFADHGDTSPPRFLLGYPFDSYEMYYEQVTDINARKGCPTLPPDKVQWWLPMHLDDPTRCTIPGHHLLSPMYVVVPPPEYHVDGPDGFAKDGAKWDAYMLEALSTVVENAKEDLVQQWSNPPWESEHRNTGLTGGSWYSTRHDNDQYWTNRPLPELSRYRVPFIDGLYLCHQSSGHPGGLCLMAVPYNCMHSLIEDGLVEPGDWWYASPWYIPEKGKISAARNK